LKSLSQTTEAITALTKLVDASPTDAEAWAELSDLYVGQGMYPQGIFALEEVLLITPNAWNVSTTLVYSVVNGIMLTVVDACSFGRSLVYVCQYKRL
jgi:hypothetical protein